MKTRPNSKYKHVVISHMVQPAMDGSCDHKIKLLGLIYWLESWSTSGTMFFCLHDGSHGLWSSEVGHPDANEQCKCNDLRLA